MKEIKREIINTYYQISNITSVSTVIIIADETQILILL